ncbi:MAG: restriction endonuclease subunit S [Elusimicrobia bacterium]|nr:restriction endonuclease subunit S [Elusimicrobiota bacterium]
MANQVTTLKMGQKFKKTPVGDIPVDWDARNIRSLAEKMLNGGTPGTSIEKYWTGDIPWITGADFVNQKIVTVRKRITREAVEHSATNVVPKGAVLVVTRTGVGKLAIAPCDVAISQDITGILPDAEVVHPEYMFWALNLYAPQLKAAHQGTSINGILRGDLEDFIIPIPPLREQKKIAEILASVDDVLQKTQSVIDKVRGIKRALAQRLLTKRAGSANGSGLTGWPFVPLGELLEEPIKNGYSPTCPSDSTGMWTLELGALSYGGFRPDRVKVAPQDDAKCAGAMLRPGDLLVSRSNTRELVGLAAIYEGNPKNCIYPDLMMRVRVSPTEMNPYFLVLYLVSSYGRRFFESEARGTSGSMLKINGEILSRMPVPKPPMKQQAEICARIQAVQDLIRREEIGHQKYASAKDALMRVLLSGRMRVS